MRDEKGAAIANAWPEDLRFESGPGTDPEYKWFSEKFKLAGPAEGLPPEIVKLNDQAWTLTTTGWCIFKSNVSLRLTRNGKIMQLLFHGCIGYT